MTCVFEGTPEEYCGKCNPGFVTAADGKPHSECHGCSELCSTTKCQTDPETFTCLGCIDGYTHTVTVGECTPCAKEGCAVCNEDPVCSKCKEGYAAVEISPGSGSFECKACDDDNGVDGCGACEYDGEVKCLECKDEYTADTRFEECLSCEEGCNWCVVDAGELSCQSCDLGYVEVEIVGTDYYNCVKCPEGCEECTYDGTDATCLDCFDGYYKLDDGTLTCVSCETVDIGCEFCEYDIPTTTPYCTTCKYGYEDVVVQGDEVECVACATGCAICEDAGTQEEECSSCLSDYYPSGEVRVDFMCTECIITGCGTCIIVEGEKYCQVCKPGFEEIEVDEVNGYVTCEKPCGNGCTSCFHDAADDIMVCTECERNTYEPVLETTCVACGEGCKECVFDEHVLKCKSCDDGFVAQNGTLEFKKCLPCGKDCKTCTENDLYCTACFDTFGLDEVTKILTDYIQCTSCGANCKTCTYDGTYQDGEYLCDVCENGYTTSFGKQQKDCFVCDNRCDSAQFCNVDVNGSTCLKCTPGYTPDVGFAQCLDENDLDDTNCEQYLIDQIECGTCETDSGKIYGKYQKTCYECGEGCSSCTADDTDEQLVFNCGGCGKTYIAPYEIALYTECQKCLTNCDTCYWSYGGLLQYCQECSPGYTPSADRLICIAMNDPSLAHSYCSLYSQSEIECVECMNEDVVLYEKVGKSCLPIEDCEVPAFDSNLCKKCDPGFFLKDGRCHSCEQIHCEKDAHYCNPYESKIQCTLCTAGYITTLHNGCVPCSTNGCLYGCDPITGKCTPKEEGTIVCDLKQVLDEKNNKCVGCKEANHCLSDTDCDDAGNCLADKCAPTFYWDGDKCAACNETLTCKDDLCTAVGGIPECVECPTGEGKDETGLCIACDVNCVTRNCAVGECKKCVSGRYWNGTICDDCAEINCVKSDKFCHTDGKCTKCDKPDFIVQGSACVKCELPCLTFSTTECKCTSCDTALYVLEDGKCILPICSNCADCETATPECTTCKDGYFKEAGSGECKSCVDVAHKLAGVGGQCVNECLPTYYLAAGDVCEACPASHNCKDNLCKFTTAVECIACDDGFYLPSNGICRECRVAFCDVTISGWSCENDNCQQCQSGYYLVDDKTCEPCSRINCTGDSKYCHPITGECTKCISGYVHNTKGECIACDGTTKNCRTGFCDPVTGQCLSCADGYFLDVSGLCFSCESKNCKATNDGKCFNSVNGCANCIDGYYKPSDKGVCVSCTQLGCAEGAACSNGVCSKCQAGMFQLITGVTECLPCSVKNCGTAVCVDGPKGCTDLNGNTSCVSGFIVQNGQCVSSISVNCDTINEDFPDQCSVCLSGFYLGEGGKCFSCTEKNCLPDSTSCNPTNGECTACVNGFFLLNGQCVDCAEIACPNSKCSATSVFCSYCGEGKTWNSVAKRCLNCDDRCSQCVEEGSATRCLKCNSGNFLLDGACHSCSENHCDSITGCDIRGKCTHCAEDYFLDTDGMCRTCAEMGCAERQCDPTRRFCHHCAETDHYPDPVSGECLLCPTMFCKKGQCEQGAKFCDDCLEGYFRNSTGLCELCGSSPVLNCSKCSTTSATCLVCAEGYTLSNGACVACEEPTIVGCSRCHADKFGCKTCSAGLILIEPTMCATCTSSLAGCLDCEVNDSGDSVCASCKAPYLLVEGECKTCSMVFENCEECGEKVNLETGESAFECNKCFRQFVEYTDPAGNFKCVFDKTAGASGLTIAMGLVVLLMLFV